MGCPHTGPYQWYFDARRLGFRALNRRVWWKGAYQDCDFSFSAFVVAAPLVLPVADCDSSTGMSLL